MFFFRRDFPKNDGPAGILAIFGGFMFIWRHFGYLAIKISRGVKLVEVFICFFFLLFLMVEHIDFSPQKTHRFCFFRI